MWLVSPASVTLGGSEPHLLFLLLVVAHAQSPPRGRQRGREPRSSGPAASAALEPGCSAGSNTEQGPWQPRARCSWGVLDGFLFPVTPVSVPAMGAWDRAVFQGHSRASLGCHLPLPLSLVSLKDSLRIGGPLGTQMRGLGDPSAQGAPEFVQGADGGHS